MSHIPSLINNLVVILIANKNLLYSLLYFEAESNCIQTKFLKSQSLFIWDTTSNLSSLVHFQGVN